MYESQGDPIDSPISFATLPSIGPSGHMLNYPEPGQSEIAKIWFLSSYCPEHNINPVEII